MEMLRIFWVILFLSFAGYTLYAIRKENFWSSCRKVFALVWGRQVTLDLYIGLLLFHFFVYIHSGSLTTTGLWLLPSLVLGNIIPLIYVIVNYPSFF